ncbi:M23 family metallopeptidase [Halomicronema hongdechloris]|uniref:M23 family metallopeptidase n=1 Tax=Halomicronema hongdechloris TaxID=1209493 RepID=UPI00165102F0|nr:M23 family metallopeptidase [Halomicronema hongdechloris]
MVNQWQRRDWSITAICVGLSSLLLAPVLVPSLNDRIAQGLNMVTRVTESADAVGDAIAPDFGEPIQAGEKIAGHPVTSGYGPRKAPCEGCSNQHRGVDLATPSGTTIYAPADKDKRVRVRCWRDGNGGGLVADIESESLPARKFQALHLSRCADGWHRGGQIIAKTGATGNGTGPHLDWRERDASGAHYHPANGPLIWALTGSKPVAPFSELSNTEKTCAIGAAEGTRDDNCDPTSAYYGHRDPGNGARNMGSFSYQHGASTPEEADQKQLARLQQAERDLQKRALEKWGQPLSKPAIAAALDIWNQSPDAGSRLIKHLPTHAPTPEQLVAARIAALNESRRELGGAPMNVPADQRRRVDQLLKHIRDDDR